MRTKSVSMSCDGQWNFAMEQNSFATMAESYMIQVPGLRSRKLCGGTNAVWKGHQTSCSYDSIKITLLHLSARQRIVSFGWFGLWILSRFLSPARYTLISCSWKLKLCLWKGRTLSISRYHRLCGFLVSYNTKPLPNLLWPIFRVYPGSLKSESIQCLIYNLFLI